jgi:hypothetical protein
MLRRVALVRTTRRNIPEDTILLHAGIMRQTVYQKRLMNFWWISVQDAYELGQSNKLHDLSRQVNYIYVAAAVSRRNYCQHLCVEVCRVVSAMGPRSL